MRSRAGDLPVQLGRGPRNGLVLFMIAVLALLSAFPTYAKTNPSEVRLAVLMPTTGTFGTSGKKAVIMAQIAAEDVVSRNLLNNTALRLIANNTQGIGNTAAKLAAWHIQNGALALYGGVISGETLPISFLATSAQIPNINPSAAAPDFSDKTAHEYHVRTIPSDEKIGAGLLAMAAYFKWDGMVLLNGDDSFGRGLNDYLIRSKPTSMQLLRYPFAVPPAVNESVMIPLLRANLQAIRSSGVRVIILHMQAAIASAILREVQASGMLGPPFVFVGTGWCAAPTIAAVNFSPSQLASLNGLTCCITHTPDDPFVTSLSNRAKAKDGVTFATGLTARELSAYDGVIAFATAVANMFANQSAPNTGTQLLRELKALDIPGALGRIRFDSRNDLLSFIDVINFQNGTFITRGTWDESTNNLTMATLNVWPDGTTNVPRAIPKDYYDGDLISAQWDARVVVTAVAIGILGSFTTVILLEQAVSRQLKQARAKTSNQKESKETGARLLWLVASSASLGGCAIWCSVFIELSGMTLGPVTPQFQPFNSLVAIPCGILAIFFGLFAAMPETDGRTSRPSSDDKALKTVAAERPGARPATAAGPVPGDQMALGRGASKRINSPFRVFLSGLTRWTFIGGVAVGGGIVLVEVVCLSALDLQAEFTTDSGLVIVSIIVALVMSVISVIIFFHVKGVWRFTSSLLFTAGILVSLHLMFLARQYVYRPLISHDEDSWNTGNITIICAASAAATEFLLMLLNVTKLKNTRNQLDRLLSVAQDQMARMEADLDSKKQEIKDLIREGEAKDTMLELINLVRPLYRPQALAFALTPAAGSDLAPPGLGSPSTQTRSVSHFSLVDKEGQPKSPQQDMKTLVKAKSTARAVDPVNSNPSKNEHEFMRLLDDYISMSLESGPVAFRATQDVKLNELMQHPVTVEILKDWLQRQMCPENVALLLDIQRYKMLTKYSSRRSMGQAIYASFIQADAPHEVNLGAGLKAKLLQSLNKKATLDVFDDVEHEIMNLITTNNMEAFTSSHQFKLCCVILGHPSYKRRPRMVTTGKSQVEQSTTGIDFTATGAVGGRPANDGDNSPRAVVRSSPMEKGSKRTLGVGGSSLREAKDSETRGLASGQLSPSPMPSRQIPESKVDPSHAAGHNVSLVSHPEPTPAIPTGSAPVAMFFVPSSGAEGESQVRTVTNVGTAANAASTTVGTATATSTDGNAGAHNSSTGGSAATNNGTGSGTSASSQTVGTPHGNNNLDTPGSGGAGITSASAIQLMPLLGTSSALASDSKSA